MSGKIRAAKALAIIKEAKENADSWFCYWKQNNINFVDQTKFWVNSTSQWDASQRKEMKDGNKIPLVAPKAYGIARRILGEQRQATPDMRVSSITSKASAEDVALHDDLVRTISFHSDAKVAYQTAFTNQLFGGFAAIKVITDYEKADDMVQSFFVKSVMEPTLCYWDPAAKETSKHDGLYAGEYVGMSRKAFEKEFPDVDIPDYEDLPLSGLAMSSKDKVFIIIYQRKEFFKKTIVQLNNGDILDMKKYEEALAAYVQESLQQTPGAKAEEIIIPPEFEIARRRTTSDYKIRTYKIAGDKILEHSTWPSKYFSYVYVDGDSHYIDGVQQTRSFFQDAQDLQTFGNYLLTQINHLVKAQRNELYLVSPENISGYEDIWNNPDLTQSALIANPDMARGGAMPQRLEPPSISPTLIQQYESLPANMNSTLGIYDAYQGNSGNEVSGVAIDNRVKQGNLSTFGMQSNLNRAIGQVGAIILDGAPKVYDTMRPMSLRSRDGSTRNVVLNQVEDGILKNDITAKDYFIEIDAGSSFEGQKQESLMALKELMGINPAIGNITADLFAENLSLGNTQVLVNRLRAGFVPPQIVAAGNGEELPPEPPPPPPPEVEFMKADIALREQKMKLDQQRVEMELDMKERQLQLDREKAEVQADIQNQKLMVDKAKVGIY